MQALALVPVQVLTLMLEMTPPLMLSPALALVLALPPPLKLVPAPTVPPPPPPLRPLLLLLLPQVELQHVQAPHLPPPSLQASPSPTAAVRPSCPSKP